MFVKIDLSNLYGVEVVTEGGEEYIKIPTRFNCEPAVSRGERRKRYWLDISLNRTTIKKPYSWYGTLIVPKAMRDMVMENPSLTLRTKYLAYGFEPRRMLEHLNPDTFTDITSGEEGK